MFFKNLFKHSLGQTYSVLFYASAPIDEIWIRSTLVKLKHEVDSLVLVIFGQTNAHLHEYYKKHSILLISIQNEQELKKIKAPLVVTASSGVKKSLFNKEIKTLIHMPHSLASLHCIYPAEAFDDYDVLFAAGEHHVREYQEMCHIRDLKNKQSFKVGYGKLDVLQKKSSIKYDPNTIVLAPSWGKGNIIESIGYSLIDSLLDKGKKIILRPHPYFFMNQPEEFLKICKRFKDEIEIEDPSLSDKSLFDSGVMISDYSGVAFEYYFLEKRPIIFVNTSRKIINKEFSKYKNDPIEVSERESIGKIAQPNVSSIIETLDEFKDHLKDGNSTLEESSLIFNKGRCADKAATIIVNLLETNRRC